MVFIDEIWKLIGGSANKQAAEFCLEIFKIIRGYGGGAVAATQDLSDFFGLEDGRYGRSILNNSKTKIILNLEPDEAEYVKDVLKLTRTEIRSITQFERGEALISSNSNKVPVIIKASREEQQMITTDRAELEAMLNELKAVANTADAAAVPDGEVDKADKGDHFWDNGESNLLKSLILYVDLDSTRTPEERNLAAVYQMLTQHTEKQLTMLFDRLPIGHPAKGPYSLFSQASDTVRAGIVLGLGTRLQVLQSEAVRRITRSSDIDLSEPGWNKCAYFIILDDQNSSLEFLSALFFAFLFIKLVRYADSTPEQRCKIPVNIILDEMNNIGSIKDFGRRLSTIRSRMLQILMCSQSLPQLQNRYPNNLWAELLGNADTQILLGATDDVTAEYFSARSGDMTVEVNSTMTTRQSLALAQVIPQYRYTEGIGRRRVLTPDEVLRLPNDELLIIIRGQKVLRAKKFDFTEHPYAKECERTSIQQYHSEQVPTQPQEALDQSIPPKPSVTELPGQAPAASEKPPAKPKASPAKPQAPAPKTPPSGDQPSELPSKPAKRPKTLYESSRPPADF